jgi:hypothetical protein
MHNPNRFSCATRLSLALVLLLTLAGCAGKQTWYQEGKGQVDYDQNAQECSLIASAFARQATMAGNSEDPGTYTQTFNNCLANKGWSMTQPQSAAAGAGQAAPVPLAVIEGGDVRAFGGQIKVPEQFVLSNATDSGVGPTVMQSYLFSGPEDTFVNILLQKAVVNGNRFEPLPYPVRPPFFLYEQGEQGAVFCGQINEEWVMGLGSYFLRNSKERITVIVTKALVAPTTEPKPGFRLSAEQFVQVEEFKREWLAWLTTNVTVPRSWWSSLSLPLL